MLRWLEESLRSHLPVYEEHGELWEPAPLLEALAEEGKTFADFDKGNEIPMIERSASAFGVKHFWRARNGDRYFAV